MLRNKDLTQKRPVPRRKAPPIYERSIVPAFISESVEGAKEIAAPRTRRVKQRKILTGSYLERPGEQLAVQKPPSFSDIFSALPDGPPVFCPHGKEAQHRVDKDGTTRIASVYCLKCYPLCVHNNEMDAEDVAAGKPYSKGCLGCNKLICTTKALLLKHYRMNGLKSTWEGTHHGTFTGGGSAEMERKDARHEFGSDKPPGWGSDTYVDEQIRVDDLGHIHGAVRDAESRATLTEVLIGDPAALAESNEEHGETPETAEAKKKKDVKPIEKRCSPTYHIQITWKLKRRSDFVVCDTCHLEVYKPEISGTKWKK
jgi:hypothetical protein